MRKLKLFFACLLMAVLSIGQMWATDRTIIIDGSQLTSTATSSATTKKYGNADKDSVTITFSDGAKSTASSGSNKFTATAILIGKTNKYFYNSTAIPGTITKFELYSNQGASTNVSVSVTFSKYPLTAAGTGTDTLYTATLSTANSVYDCSGKIPTGAKYFYYKVTNNYNSQVEARITYTPAGGSSDPSVSLNPTSASVAATDVANQSVALTASNFASAISSVTTGLYSDAQCNTAITSGQWVKDIIVNAGKTAVTFNVDDNDGNQRQCWLKITASDGSKSASAILPITQAKYSAPTGTFKLFSGDIVEGDYVICSGAKAMKNVATSSPRIDVADVTISDDEIVNPDESVIWKFEALTGDDAGYWTFFNEAVSKYAAFNGTDARGTLIASVTDYAKFNHVASTSYDFQNKGKTGKYLRYNNGYGFASYGNTTGSALTLYKKAVPFALTINSSIANGSVGASEGSTAISSGSNVLSGTEVTLSNSPASGYKLKAYDVYKTGESTTKVTVTNGKFTMPDYAVTVSASFEATKTLSSISLSGTQRTTFWVGETFSSTGLVVTAHYDDESSATVTPASISSPDMSTAGEKTITVTYTEGTTKSNTYTINVKALPTTQGTAGTVADLIDIYDKLGNQSNLYIKGTIYKINGFYSEKYISYWITDSYDGEANPNHSNEFELYNGLDFDGADFTAATDLEVGQYVIVKGNLTKYSSTYEFATGNEIVSRPKVLKGIALSGSQPTEFTQGDEFSSEGLIVTASYNYGANAPVTPTSITGYNMSATGNQTVTVSYTEGGVTKTATYGISVAAPDLCEHKATISKGAEVNGTFSLSVSGEQCLDELEGYKTSTVLTATPAEHYHLSEVTATVGTVGTIADNECTISDIDASTTITAVFVENDKVTVKFAMGTESATGDVPADVANKYAGQSVTLPANPFTYTGSPIKVFGGWKHSLTNEVKQPGSYTITAADAAVDNITFTAVWNDLSPWATVYTSNVTLSGSQNVNVTITVDEEDTNFAGVKMNKAAAATFTIPAGTTNLYAHMAAWNGEAQTVTVSGDCFDDDKEISIIADANVSGSGTTYDIDDAKAPLDYFKEIILDNEVTEPTEITITAASGKRFVLFGVNATYPAAIALDPTSKNFGEVKENASAQQEFTITPNAMSTGDLVASIIGTDAAKFSVGAISENKVTVTFTPGEVGGPYSASLKVESGNAEVTAALSGTGITALTPEIGIDKDEVAFGNVEQNSTPATQSVAVTLSNIDEDGVSAAITGSAFTLSTNKLTANGSIVITPVTTTPGVYSETLTLSATGATSKTVTVTMTVVDEWAYVYTSNVTISSDVDAKVTINEVNYDAVKANKGSSATTITLPQGVTKIHMHLVAWKGEAQTVTISGDCFDEDKEIDIIANDGVSGSGTTYPLGASGVDYYCSLTPDKAVAANTEITIATEGQKRFVLFGVNQVGGIVPVLDHITVSGDLTTKSGYKTGDDLDLDGLTVEAVYTLGGVPQTPVDITDKLGDGLTLTYDPLVVDQTEVTITATYEGKSDDIVITLDEAVVSGDPVIITDVSSRSWTSVSQYTTPATKTVTVTLKNVAAATATLGGTNPEVFSIDKTALVNGDVITISVNTETAGNFAATITISDNATENPAEDKVVSLSLTVTEAEQPETPVGTFTRWIPATEIKDGMEVLIVGVDGTKAYAMGTQNNNNRTAVEGSVDGEGVLTPGASTMSFTLVAQVDGTYAIRTSTGKYLYAAASGNNYLRTQADVDNNAKWTLTVASAVAESSSNRNVMQFNSGSTIFSCYASANQKPIQFYVRKADYTRDVTEGRIGTICLPKAGKMEGVSLFQISYMDYEGDGVTPHKIYFDELPSNEMIAGRPYIFLPNEGASKLGVYYTSDETASAGHLNGLYGTLTEMNTANSTGADLLNNFIFSNNLFYLVNSSTVRLQANRAYVKACDELPGWDNPGYVAPAPAFGLRRLGIGGEAPQVTTGMENVQTDDAQTTKVLINGQFFILRGEKMYDATGRLVK